MKKFLAMVLAVLLIASSGVVAFAADKSAFQFKQFSDYEVFSSVISQFDVGNGNYVLPIESGRSIDNLNSYFNSSSWIPFYKFSIDTGGNFRLGLYFLPRGNIKFVKVNISGKDYYSFFYNNYVRPFYVFCDFVFRDGYFYPFYYLSGSHVNSTSYLSLYSASSTETTFETYGVYFPDDSLYSYIPDSYISQMPYLRFISDISSISFVSIDDYVPPAPSTRTLTINYLYSENNPAADTVTQTLEPGSDYSIPSPEIEGYTPSISLVTGTMPDEDLTIDVYYSKSFYPLTVKYQYQDGSKAAEDVTFQYPSGFTYDIPSPEIAGYQPNKPSIVGTMQEGPLTEIVTYTAIPYTLTVNYQYTDGSKAAESHQQQLTIGSHYSVLSPTIEGFHPNQTSVTGIMPARNVIATVTYREDSGGSTGTGGAGPDEGGESGGEQGGDSGNEGESGKDPFNPVLPPFSGKDPFVVPGAPGYSGYDPFVVPKIPGYSGYDPFIVPKIPAFNGYDPFSMPEHWGDS